MLTSPLPPSLFTQRAGESVPGLVRQDKCGSGPLATESKAGIGVTRAPLQKATLRPMQHESPRRRERAQRNRAAIISVFPWQAVESCWINTTVILRTDAPAPNTGVTLSDEHCSRQGHPQKVYGQAAAAVRQRAARLASYTAKDSSEWGHTGGQGAQSVCSSTRLLRAAPHAPRDRPAALCSCLNPKPDCRVSESSTSGGAFGQFYKMIDEVFCIGMTGEVLQSLSLSSQWRQDVTCDFLPPWQRRKSRK